MKRKPLFFIALLMINGLSYVSNAQQKINPSIEAKVTALLRQMTLEEKVGQMAQVSIESLGSGRGNQFSFSDKLKDAVVNYKIGSILNSPGPLQSATDWNRIITEIQDRSKETRLKIPVLYGLDHIHGLSYVAGSTLFPQPIGQAATWNRQLSFNSGLITAYESRAAGVPWTFSPALDLGTNPLWPRIWEGYGEDPYLIGELGVQFVKGLQEPLGDKEKSLQV
jgi:beta-glucosidase